MMISRIEKKVIVTQPHTPRASTIPPTVNPTTPTASRGTTRLNPTTKASMSTNKVATTQTATTFSTKFQTTIQKTSWNHGSTTWCKQRTKLTTCWQRLESRRGSSDRAGFTGSRQDCQTQRRSLDKACLKLECSNINQAERVPETWKTATRWEDDFDAYLQPTRTNRDDNDLTSDTTQLTTAQNGSKWDSVGSDFSSSRLKQPA